MTIYLRTVGKGSPLKFFTAPRDLEIADGVFEAFFALSCYVEIDEPSLELTFLVPAEFYTPGTSIVRSSKGILVSKTRPDYAKNYLNSLDIMESPSGIFGVLLAADKDRRFELPDEKVSPLLSYRIKDDGEILMKRHKKWVKEDFEEEDLFDYFSPIIASSQRLYSLYKSPITCKVGEGTTKLLFNGHSIQTHTEFFNIYDGRTSKGCIYYQDLGGKSLKTILGGGKCL